MNKFLPVCLVFMAGLVGLSAPLPASAEVLNGASCANPSWKVLANGACVPGEATLLLPPSSAADRHGPALAALEPPAGMIPEPGTYALLMVGLVLVIGIARKRRGV